MGGQKEAEERFGGGFFRHRPMTLPWKGSLPLCRYRLPPVSPPGDMQSLTAVVDFSHAWAQGEGDHGDRV
ncbi:MAG: hypothetical protein Fur0034_21080 [Desulfuromonadia bacterium]